MLRPFHTKSEINKAQAEGNAYLRLYSRGKLKQTLQLCCHSGLKKNRIQKKDFQVIFAC